jgi:hypothetical protein
MTVIMTLRNPLDKEKMLPVYIEPNDTQLAKDWVLALKTELQKNSPLEKNYCWHGWPNGGRTLEYLCEELTKHTTRVNNFNETGIWQSNGLAAYPLHNEYYPDYVRRPITGINIRGQRGGGLKHEVMNEVHNYFEHLQGTVENLSMYYKFATPEVKYSIRQINNLCHEIETLVMSQKHAVYEPEWVRPSQITTFLNATRFNLTDEHRKGFSINGYDRHFAHVYMHWTQIGKTLFEVFHDENAPHLDQATCDAITHLQYYSGEFDIEWARDVIYEIHSWHRTDQDRFKEWLIREGYDPTDPQLSLGYLELGHVDLHRSFGTIKTQKILEIMSNYLDIYSLQVDDVIAVYDYAWSDSDHEERQLKYMMPGYKSHV